MDQKTRPKYTMSIKLSGNIDLCACGKNSNNSNISMEKKPLF